MEDHAHKFDDIDRRLLASLQQDAQATSQDLADRLGLSASQISRRRQRLEASGLIRNYSARLDAAQLGLTIQAFVQVEMHSHGADQSRAFARLVDTCAEVVSAWTLTGSTDYLLRVYCVDLAALNRFIQDRLSSHPAVAKVRSQIVMDQFKADAPLPL